jgi:hypothetical protein
MLCGQGFRLPVHRIKLRRNEIYQNRIALRLRPRSKKVVRGQERRVLRVETCFNIFIAAFYVCDDDLKGVVGGVGRKVLATKKAPDTVLGVAGGW